MQWSHTVLGQFDITDQWIGLDYRSLFLDPIKAEITVFHELTHAVLSRTTEMGQATQNIFFFSQWFQHLNPDQINEIKGHLVACQKFPQEGLATFMEMQQLRVKGSRESVVAIKPGLHQEYRERFEKMEFIFYQPKKVRERFTKKISLLVMSNGFRSNAPRADLLRDPKTLQAYLAVPDHNPTQRLEKVLTYLRKNPRILRKKPRKIAKACGIEFFEPATSQEICDYINYLQRLSGKEEDYSISMVGEVKGKEMLNEAIENLLVTNMNLDPKQTADPLWDTEDIEYEADYASAALIVHHPQSAKDEEFEKQLGRALDVNILMFGADGAKYLAITSREHLDSLLANQLKNATIITHWSITDPSKNTFDLSSVRKPDIIQYNRPGDMLNTFKNAKNMKKYEWIHLGASQNHPFHSLLVKTNGSETIHFVNGFGNSGISKVIEFMAAQKGYSIRASALLPQARAINDMLAVMGLPWDVDWVRTMNNQREIIRR